MTILSTISGWLVTFDCGLCLRRYACALFVSEDRFDTNPGETSDRMLIERMTKGALAG